MSNTNARAYHTTQTHYIRKRVNWNDFGVSAGVQFGVLPAGSLLTNAICRVNTAFNAGTTNVLRVGTTATGAEVMAEAVTLSGATGFKSATSGTAFAAQFASDTPLFVSYTQTGTAATAGQADIVISFAPNNDQ